MARVLAVAETRDGTLRGVSREIVSEARRIADGLGGGLDVLVAGSAGVAAAASELAAYGADRIFVAEDETLAVYNPDAALRAIEGLHAEHAYAAVAFAATAQGKDLSPRLAARLERGLASDITGWDVVDGRLRVTRPQFAGKALAHLAFKSAPAIVSLRPNVFKPESASGAGETVSLAVEPEPRRIRVTGLHGADRGAIDVAEAGIIVSGGRGMQGPEHWQLLEDLVGALGEDAALGASRAVVDAGWRDHGEQVGQTGKTVSPNLYFAIGISGAIQHQAGMRTAKVIVAVNKDPEAPIFKLADYGIVGDLFEVVPKLAAEIRSVRADG